MAQTVELSSTNRAIDLETPLPKDELVAERVSGIETLGRLFQYELIAVSSNGNIVFDDVLGRHVTVLFELPDQQRRSLDGHVAQIGLIGMVESLYRYRLVLRPWTWMLTRASDCRIFQEKTVRQILEDVFVDHPSALYEMQLTAQYAKRTYCATDRGRPPSLPAASGHAAVQLLGPGVATVAPTRTDDLTHRSIFVRRLA